MLTRGPNMRTRLSTPKSRPRSRSRRFREVLHGIDELLRDQPAGAPTTHRRAVGKLRDDRRSMLCGGDDRNRSTTACNWAHWRRSSIRGTGTRTLPTFFCAMEPRRKYGPDGTKSSSVSAPNAAEYKLKTALKYWNAERGDGDHHRHTEDAISQLRPGRRPPLPDTGLVEVDSGYIWITSGRGRHPRIKTSKALKICGTEPDRNSGVGVLLRLGASGNRHARQRRAQPASGSNQLPTSIHPDLLPSDPGTARLSH